MTAMLLVAALAAVVAGCSASTFSDDRPLVLGAADNPTMRVMAAVYAGALRNAGSAVAGDVRIGDDQVLLDEMDLAAVDLFPAFSGQLLAQLAPQLTPIAADDVYADLNKSLPQGVSVGDPTMVSAQPHIFVATRTADASRIADLADCTRLPAGLPVVVIGEPDAATLSAATAAGCRFGPIQTASTTNEVISRVAAGTAVGILTPLDVAGDDAGGAAGKIRALKSAAPESAETSAPQSSSAPDASAAPTTTVVGTRAQDLLPVYRDAALSGDEVKTVNKVAGELTTADLASLTRRAIAGEKPADVASGWLAEHAL